MIDAVGRQDEKGIGRVGKAVEGTLGHQHHENFDQVFVDTRGYQNVVCEVEILIGSAA